MKTILKLAVALIAIPPLRAQVVNDGATNTLSNVTTNFTGDVTVGTNGSFTLLVLSDNALLTNSANGVISANASARSNEVRLASPSATWLMGGTLFVGSNGAFSTLVVSNGAFVRANAGIIGRRATSGSNVVLVTGAGSMWSNVAGITGVGLTVGSLGSGNQLVVSNGGWVVNANASGTIGSNSSNNVARVTGPGSVWSNRFALNINPIGAGNANNGLVIENGGQVFNDDGLINGLNGSSNNFAFITGNGAVWNNSRDLYLGGSVRASLTVSNGGAVLSANSYVGSGGSQMLVTGGGSRWSHQNDLALVGQNNTLVVINGGSVVNSNGYMGGLTGGAVSASNNTVVVTGAGSTWSNRADLFVGFAGPGNQLVVSNGATVPASNVFVGFNSSSLANRVTVDGGTLRVTNASGTSVLDVRRGTNVLNAGLVEVDQLLATNAAGKFELNGGRLITRGAVISRPFFVGNSVTTPAIWDARAGAGNHRLAQDLFIGNNSPFNQMLVTNGGVIFSGRAALIGSGSGGSSNTVFVSGPGSQWLFDEEDSLYVGYRGVFNRLIVTNGGVVDAAGCIVGGEDNATNCEAIITGPGSALGSALAALQIGSTGSTNRVRVENGGRLMGDFQVGRTVNSVGNVLWVTDPGSRVQTLSQTSDQFVGYDGPASTLIVSNGAVVSGFEAVIGLNASSSNNLALVTGPGSLWTNRGEMYVGQTGSGNQLVISNGGTVFAQTTRFLSHSSGATSNNLAIVTGTGSRWLGPGNLEVGGPGAFCRLLVSDGGLVENSSGFVGSGSTASNNLAVVTGTGSVWSNIFHTFVGNGSSGNRLLVSNGGFVMNGLDLYVGDSGGSSNIATITGTGSRWAVNRSVGLGYNGSYNRLTIDNGASLASGNTEIGGNFVSEHNVAVASGMGTTWTNSSALIVGGQGSLNGLAVSNGACVVSSDGVIGARSTATSNGGLVSGAGSRWLMSGNLYLGSNAAFNALVVNDGGLVANSYGVIGFSQMSVGNVAQLSGAGSVWSNQQDLIIGDAGNGNRLEVSEGARVESNFGIFGRLTSASNNLALVTGPGSFWKVQQRITVGSSGGGNRLVISDGGVVAAAGSGTALIIGDSPNSANNEIIITGPGSTYSNVAGINVDVGSRGYSNRLRIENGGLLVANPIIGNVQTSTGNVLTVTGPGSRIVVPRADIELIVGEEGPGNSLVVSNGAAVLADGAAIGYDATSSNNLAVVTGAGSVWSNQNVLKVGDFGRNNRLFITDGGTVSSTNAVNVGFRTTTSSNNLLHVANGTLRVTNLVGTGTFDVRSGTNRLDAGLIDVDQLVLTNALGKFEFNGGTLITRGAAISNGQPFVVGGPGGVPGTWDVRAGAGNHLVSGDVIVGEISSLNQLIVSNGALLTNSEGFVGLGSKSNVAVVAGAGSRWVLGSNLEVGSSGSFNSLVISNGGLVADTDAVIGEGSSGSNNLALVTGAGSVWSNQVSMRIGFFGSNNRLLITDGGAVFASNLITAGFNSAASSNNLIQINGGTLRVQNLAGTGTLDIRSGTNRLDTGLVDVDRLVITNGRGEFAFNGGTLRTAGTTIGHGRVFTVGNGTSAATFELRGGTHVLLGGLVVANQASLTGNGSVPGALTVQAGGTLAPGASIGKLAFNNSPALQGTTVMEISKNGATLTNDQIQVAGTLTYGGSLTVTNLGSTALAAGDRFQLFSAAPFAGSFATIALPPLGTGLAWVNNLLVDGSIEVLAPQQPGFASIRLSGGNVIIAGTNGTANATYAVLTATNVALPLSNWVSIATNRFDSSGGFSFTNGIPPGEPQRFFRIRTP